MPNACGPTQFAHGIYVSIPKVAWLIEIAAWRWQHDNMIVSTTMNVRKKWITSRQEAIDSISWLFVLFEHLETI